MNIVVTMVTLRPQVGDKGRDDVLCMMTAGNYGNTTQDRWKYNANNVMITLNYKSPMLEQ